MPKPHPRERTRISAAEVKKIEEGLEAATNFMIAHLPADMDLHSLIRRVGETPAEWTDRLAVPAQGYPAFAKVVIGLGTSAVVRWRLEEGIE